MKKIFTLAAAMLFTASLFAADVVIALTSFTKDGNTYSQTWSGEQKAKNNVIYVEVPSVTAEGEITFTGASDKNDRFLYIYGTNGTAKDDSRKIVMTVTPVTIAFDATDVETKDAKYYLHFSTSDDYKYKGISYTLNDPTKATVKSISVNGVALAEFAADKLSYDVELAFGTVDIPEVTAVAGDGASIVITQATAVDGSASVVCTSKDGTSETKTYTLNFSVAASQSTDASLKGLQVDGKDMPEFKADSFEYEWTVPYASTTIPVVTVEVNDPTANAVVTPATAITKAKTDEGTTVIVVTAQDGTTKLTYKVAFIRADAIKKINEVIMTNSYSAFIPAGEFDIHAYYLQGEESPTFKSYKVDDNTTWSLSGDVVTLTSTLDASTVDYNLLIEAVAPVEFTTETITFDGHETWIKAGYGFGSNSWKFSKTDNDYSREIPGKTHIEMFLPACDTIALTEGTGNARDIRLYANGTEIGNKHNLPKNGTLTVAVEQANAFMLTIASAQTSGDGGVKAIRMAKKATPTSIDNTAVNVKAVKVIENGQMIIIKNGVKYDLTGSVIR